MHIKVGHYRTEFSEDGIWKTYYKDNLIAATKESMWNYPDVIFSSQQAGELLLQTTIEITASLDNIIMEPELGMEKTDEGDTQDVPSPSDKIHYNNNEENVPLSEENLIIIKIQNLLDKVSESFKTGRDASNVLAELNIWQNRLEILKVAQLKQEYKELIKSSEKDLKEGIDCTAKLDRIEEIVKVLNGKEKY